MAKNPERDDLRVVVIGAGMAGVLAAIKLREAGFSDITIYEKADRLGGTWRENTYPGVACDIPSHLYALAGHPNPGWRRRYGGGAEIQAYLRGVAAREARKGVGVRPAARARCWSAMR